MNHSGQLNKVGFRWVNRGLRVGLIAALLLLSAGATPARADTSVCGPISVDTTWTVAGNNYTVTCLVQVMQGVTLTIEPGVRVYFDAGIGLRVDGELIAHGVTFIPNSSTPSKGSWAHILFTSTSEDAVFDEAGNYLNGSIIQDSLITYGGGGTGVVGVINVAGASPFLDNNNIFNSSTRGIYAIGRSSTTPIHITRNAVNANNGGGIYVSNGLVEENRVYDNSNGGVYAINSELNENEVYNNTGGNGAGIYASGCILDANTVSGNSGTSGAGIYAEGGIISNNVVSGNSAQSLYHIAGGGIYAKGGTLIGNTVSGNSAYSSWEVTYGGGIYSAQGTVTNNTVLDNTIITGEDVYGGGIFSDGSTLTGNVIRGNTANSSETDDRSYGGGVFADGGSVRGNTIEGNNAAGGADNMGGGVYGNIAVIDGNTISGNSANKGGAIYAYRGTVSSNTVLTNTTAISGTLYIDQGTATQNILRANTAVAGGALYGVGANLSGNTAEENSANFGAGIYALNSTVRGNTLTGNTALSDGGGIYAIGGTVTGNTMTANTAPAYGHGSGAYIIDVTDFSYNNVLDNTAPGGTAGGVSVSGQPVLHYNNLYGNTPYDAEVVSSLPVTGTLNYWGPSTCTAIPNQIYDGLDLPGFGVLSYAPSLYSPIPVAQMAVPSDLALTQDELSVQLSWTPIPPLPNVGCRVPGSSDPDVGYLVYYGDDSCAPYGGTGLPEGGSPIDVGTATSLTLEAISGPSVYFVVTAYDFLDRQSAFSNVVWSESTEPEMTEVFLPLLAKN